MIKRLVPGYSNMMARTGQFARGYIHGGCSAQEISQKRLLLLHALAPESLHSHISRLNDIGYRDVQLWFRSINFTSMMAWK